MRTRIPISTSLLAFGLAWMVAGCQPQAQPQPPQVITVVVTAPAPPSTAIPTLPEPPLTGPIPTGAPACTVQQQVNFRSGPGKAYNPPLRSFEAGTLLTPSGFNPLGAPEGAWAQVLDPQNNQLGWINAEEAFIKCNIDLTRLPSVAVQPPPPPPVPRVSNTQPDGNPRNLIGEIIHSPDFLIQMRVRDENFEKDGEGIDWVKFQVRQNNQLIYERIERAAGYCIFTGGEPDCAPWPQTDGKITWGVGGPAVESGEYDVDILVLPKSAQGNENELANWSYKISLQMP